MSWQHLRRIASAVLVLAALVLGGVVGNLVLLRSADTTNATVGQLSARLDTPVVTAAPTTTRVTTTRSPVPNDETSSERADARTPDD
jgi:hypothetical protein